MPDSAPSMHFAQNDDDISCKIDDHLIPRNFWPNGDFIEVKIVKEDPKELVRMGYRKKPLTLHLMRYTPRALIPTMKTRYTKLFQITDAIICFMIYPLRNEAGQIVKFPTKAVDYVKVYEDDKPKNVPKLPPEEVEKLQEQEAKEVQIFNNVVLFHCNLTFILDHQVVVYENLVLNPSLICLPPSEFDQYVHSCIQAQRGAEEFVFKPISIPYRLPHFEGVQLRLEKIGPDEFKIEWGQQLKWETGDWIGIYRPYSVAPDLHIAKFVLKEKPEKQSFVIKMYPVPYGDVVFRYFRQNSSIAYSQIAAFGEPIAFSNIEVQSNTRHISFDVGGDLPRFWSLSMVSEDGKEIARARPEEGTKRVEFQIGKEHKIDTFQIRVIADLWGDCLAVQNFTLMV